MPSYYIVSRFSPFALLPGLCGGIHLLKNVVQHQAIVDGPTHGMACSLVEFRQAPAEHGARVVALRALAVLIFRLAARDTPPLVGDVEVLARRQPSGNLAHTLVKKRS